MWPSTANDWPRAQNCPSPTPTGEIASRTRLLSAGRQAQSHTVVGGGLGPGDGILRPGRLARRGTHDAHRHSLARRPRSRRRWLGYRGRLDQRPRLGGGLVLGPVAGVGAPDRGWRRRKAGQAPCTTEQAREERSGRGERARADTVSIPGHARHERAEVRPPQRLTGEVAYSEPSAPLTALMTAASEGLTPFFASATAVAAPRTTCR